MAENLDDFFAKRDKKKGKSKKFLSSEELVKQLEQAAKEKELSKKPAKIDEENEDGTIHENDDEWKEFEPEKKPDLSNLKLGQLTLSSEQQSQNLNSENENDANYNVNDGDSTENPWNKAGASAQPTQAKQPEPAAKSGVYVPPSVTRGENARAARSKKNAPDLHNQEFFPSLGTEKVEQPKAWRKDGFEEVKHGGKLQSADDQTVPVSIGNKFSSLFNDVDS